MRREGPQEPAGGPNGDGLVPAPTSPAAIAYSPFYLKGCRVCEHIERQRLDLELERGEAIDDVAQGGQVTKGSVFRHLRHMPYLARKRRAVLGGIEATALEQARDLLARAMESIEQLDGSTEADAVRWHEQARADLTLVAKLLGELDERAQVNVLFLELGVSQDRAREMIEAGLEAEKATEEATARESFEYAQRYYARMGRRLVILDEVEAAQ